MEIINKYKQFQEYVKKYMSMFPKVFEIVFGEFDSKGFNIDAQYKDGKALFLINPKEWEDESGNEVNINHIAKMAVLFFIDDYFRGPFGDDHDMDKEHFQIYEVIAYLISDIK